MRVKSIFDNGDTIPKKYCGDISPPLIISNIPETADYIRVIVSDPDAPNGTWIHWNIKIQIPKDVNKITIPEGFNVNSPLVLSIKENSWGNKKYQGPKPPKGSEHRYFFKVMAFNSKREILSKATLMGVYSR